ncbi:MAG: c-type cytochrome [Chitinophagaceae bacterium]|nr:c-type cytochrome [Chitinophagaceae bacterium]
MKKLILPIAMICLLASCGGGDKEKKDTPATDTKTDKPAEPTADLSSNPDYQKGLELIGGSDCLTCHKIEEKLTGPSYREVADKYAAMPDTIVTHLANKIIHGGTGVWGQTPMTAHAGLSQADAEAMVKYILLLKSK